MKIDGNTLFIKDRHRMYGTRFGWAITYKIVSSEYDTIKVKISKGRIQPEDVLNTRDVTKFDLVVGCVHELLRTSRKNVILSIYGKEIRFDSQRNWDKLFIAKEIRDFQRSLIAIDESVDVAIRRQIVAAIDKSFTTIDIY